MGGKGSGRIPNTDRLNEIGALLAQKKPVLSLAEIGRRFGVSREYIRQLAGTLGVSGRKRTVTK